MTCNVTLPLQVYILVGQSNMQGMADIKSIPYIGMDPRTVPLLDMIQTTPTKKGGDKDEASFYECENVWISVIGGKGEDDDQRERHGRLTVGYGATKDKIGPELLFGMTLEKKWGKQQPILIIKTAWGGKNLHTDFRPPSAGAFEFSSKQLQQLERTGLDINQERKDKEKVTGKYYHLMVKHIRHVLENISDKHRNYSLEKGYNIAGFVWFQGWNDVVDSGFYTKRNQPGGYDEYSRLLSLLIQDVRHDLGVPKLPFVIGIIGVHGPQDKDHLHTRFRDAMEQPVKQKELQPIAAVRTEQFWDSDLEDLDKKWNELVQKKAKANQHEHNLGQAEFRAQVDAIANNVFSPEELKRYRTGKTNAAYHYFGSAKFMAQAGQAFAEALFELQESSGQ